MKRPTALSIFFAVALSLGGCGGEEKKIFSNWTRTDTALSIDFTDGRYAEMFKAKAKFAAGGDCDLMITMTGGNAATKNGTATVMRSTYVEGSGTIDPGCRTLVGDYGYLFENGQLLLCPGAGGVVKFDEETCGQYQ